MASKTKLQIPIDQKMKNLLKARIQELGFTSLNEAVRVLLKQFSEGRLTMIFYSDYAPMVDEETERRIGESLEDIKKGRYVDVNPFDKEALQRALNQ